MNFVSICNMEKSPRTVTVLQCNTANIAETNTVAHLPPGNSVIVEVKKGFKLAIVELDYDLE